MQTSEARSQANMLGIVGPTGAGSKSSAVTTRLGSCGFLTRHERLGLSWRGRLLLAVLAMTVGAVLLLTVHPFLAAKGRVDTSILVVEGWVHDFAIRAGAQEFNRGGYSRVFTTGGPVTGSGGYTTDANTTANVGADLMRKAGVSAEFVQMVPAKMMGRDRTYSSAVALRDWFREHHMEVRSLNVVTEGVHARRTRLLFQKAFGAGVPVGIIAVPNPDYDAKRWWYYSDGVREVVGEVVAYVYARLFFHPSIS